MLINIVFIANILITLVYLDVEIMIYPGVECKLKIL
jgi:hypothetical protein